MEKYLKCAINVIDDSKLKMIPIDSFVDNYKVLLPQPFLEIYRRKGFIETLTDENITSRIVSDIIAMIADISNIIAINTMSLMKNNNIPVVSAEPLYNDLVEIVSESYIFNNPDGIVELAKAKNFGAYHRYMYTYIPALLGDIYCRLQRESGMSNMYNISMYSNNTSLIINQILGKINILIAYYLNDLVAFIVSKLGFDTTPDYTQVLDYKEI